MSKVEIVNKALTLLGANRITSLSDDTLEAKSASNIYEQSLRSVLSECGWKFATKRQNLNRLDLQPDWAEDGMSNYFQLPSDFVEIFGVKDDSVQWDKEGQYILTNASSFAIKYVYYCDDTTLYPAYFIDAFACKLAADMCYELTNSNDKTMTLLELYKGDLLPIAKSRNARATSQKQLKDGHWIESIRGTIYG